MTPTTKDEKMDAGVNKDELDKVVSSSIQPLPKPEEIKESIPAAATPSYQVPVKERVWVIYLRRCMKISEKQ